VFAEWPADVAGAPYEAARRAVEARDRIAEANVSITVRDDARTK